MNSFSSQVKSQPSSTFVINRRPPELLICQGEENTASRLNNFIFIHFESEQEASQGKSRHIHPVSHCEGSFITHVRSRATRVAHAATS